MSAQAFQVAIWPREHVALPRPGDVVDGKYRIEAEVARGGMAAIFAAEQLVLGHRVAVKVGLSEVARTRASADRLLLEARATARLETPHTVRILDAGVLDSGLPFLVMEYLEGVDLGALLAQRGAMAPSDVADFVLQALAGLAHAHAAGLVHRDLKPSNLFLTTRHDGSQIIKLLDFGVSLSLLDGPGEGQAQSDVIGSPSYMSPEHVRSAQDVDERSDIWALGVTMYELLTGVAPFDTSSLGATFAAILERSPVSPRRLRPAVPEGLARVVRACLRPSPHERPADAAALARALAPYGSGRWGHLVREIEATLARGGDPASPLSLGHVTLMRLTTVDPPIDALAPTLPPPGHPLSPGDRTRITRRRRPALRIAAVALTGAVAVLLAVSLATLHVRSGTASSVMRATPAPAQLGSPAP